MMRVDLEAPLPPHGGNITIGMQYSFNVPEHGSDRMGRDSALYEIAQWYPRMAVYDDVRGWNTDPYLGQGEFYLEYGDIDYAVTVPADYIVAGSGVLQNRAEVLTPAEVERLDRAAHVDRRVIPDHHGRRGRRGQAPRRAAEPRPGASAPSTCAMWRGARRPISGGTPRAGTACLTQAYTSSLKPAAPGKSAAEQTQWSIRTYSDLWIRYPYPQATSVAGPVAGMEYPMFIMAGYGTAIPRRSSDDRSRAGPRVVSDDRRIERAAVCVDGRGLSTHIRTRSRTSVALPAANAFPEYLANWRQSVERGDHSRRS